jgi:hypothetical protein
MSKTESWLYNAVSEIAMNHLYIILNYWFLLIIILDNFHVHTVHLDKNQIFSSTDAKLDSLKKIYFALKLTLKRSCMFRCENTIIREHTVWSLLKLQLLKWVKIHWCGLFGGVAAYVATPPNEPHPCILTHFNNCNFSKVRTVCSLKMVFSRRNMQELFNVNFNAKLKLFLRLSNCVPVGKKTL